jgi:hypothetical protein
LLDYTRHFVLLLALAVGLVAASRLAAALSPGLLPTGALLLSPSGIASQFAVYGAMHAFALVSSLAPRPSTRRRIALITAAGAMSGATAWLTVVLVRRMSNLSGPGPILVTAAALGAWAYASTIRCLLRVNLAARSIGWISLATATAVAAAYPWATHRVSDAGLMLAIPWWVAFSVAFALQDARRRR